MKKSCEKKRRKLHEEVRRRIISELHLCVEEQAVDLGTEAKKRAARFNVSFGARRVLAFSAAW